MFVAPVFERLDRSDVAERFLRNVLIVDWDRAPNGLGQRHSAESKRVVDLIEAMVVIAEAPTPF